MEFKNLIIRKEDNVCIVTINNPQSMNSLNSEVLSELDKVFTNIEEDHSIDVVILTGEGRAFVAGADISQMSTMNAAEGKDFGEQGSKLFRKIELLPKPVIAAINGFALGGGCELALACDIRISSSKAKLGQPEVGLGITPGFSGTQRLPRIVGEGRAKELIYTAKAITAEEAYRIGLVNKVVEPEVLIDEALALAKQIAEKSASAVALAKLSINSEYNCSIEKAISMESQNFGKCFENNDQKEGMSAFLNKRNPEFTDKVQF